MSRGTPGVVLNLDDTDESRYRKTRILRRMGLEVVECATGAEALRLTRELLPDVVLCDVRLPDMSGLEVCRQIKQENATAMIPVVQISATFLTERDEAEALRHGADIYLTESLEPRELETTVGVLLRLTRTEAGLRENERRWKRLTESDVVGILIGENDRIVEANHQFLAMVGRSPEEVASGALSLIQLSAPEHRETTRRAIDQVLERGSCPAYEEEYLRPNGTRVAVTMSATVVDASRRRWLGLVLDVSDRKRLELEREETLSRERLARSQAEQATRLKDEFIANLSHELRTPMNIIVGWTHLLRSGRLDEAQRSRAAESIERAARSQAQLIEDLLDVSRIATGKFSLQMREVELGPIVTLAAESLRLVAQNKNVTLSLALERGPMRVLGDADRLQQVLWNLLSNAVKFTPSGGRVSVKLNREDSTAHIVVADTGIGITPEFLPFVFDRFRQADATSTRQHSGMGLGLAIVRHTVTMHGGTVDADSAGLDRGATFTVRLPLLTASDSLAAEADGAAGRPRAHPTPSLRVLLVEDDPDTREVIGSALAQEGFVVTPAGSASEALEHLGRCQPQVIVSDIGMPAMDGYEFMRQVRTRNPEGGGLTPAVALTAYAGQQDAARAYASGYQAHLPKPVDPDALRAVILNIALPRAQAPGLQAEPPQGARPVSRP